MAIDVVLANHDEDNDGFDDAIDKCPGIADSAQADTDGDGVGDRCDPHPDNGIDRIYYFDAFETMSPRWTPAGGSWAIDNSGRIVQSSTAFENGLLVLDATTPLAAPTVEAIIDAVGTIDAGAYLAQSGAGSLPPGIGCYLDNRYNWLYYFEYRPSQPNYNMSFGSEVTGTGYPLRIIAASDSGNSANGPPLCTAQRVDSVVPIVKANPTSTPGIALATAALYTYGATASFRSVTIYTRR